VYARTTIDPVVSVTSGETEVAVAEGAAAGTVGAGALVCAVAHWRPVPVAGKMSLAALIQ
jgi:hypothetical protein